MKLYFNTVLLLGIFIVLIVGSAAYIRQRKVLPNRIWFLTSISGAFWSLFYFFTVNTTDKQSAFIFITLADISALVILLSWFLFVIAFLDIYEKIKKSKIFWFVLLSGFVVAILHFTPWFIKDLVPKYIFNYYVVPGIGYYLYVSYFILVISYGFTLLLKSRNDFSLVKQGQIRYFTIASTMGFVGGCSVFLLAFDVFIPPYLLILFTAFPIILTYAIAKYELFNIKVVATELSVVGIWILLLARVILSSSYQDLIINVVILFSVAVVGVLLIRSVMKEVRQREELERLTKEVQRAYEVEKKANLELEKLGDAKNQFIMATQHHLRTPLTAMIGYVDLLLGGSYGNIPPKIKDTVVKFQVSTSRLIRIVNELLDISQFQLGKKVVTLQPGINLQSIIDEVVEEVKFEAEKKKLYLKVEKSEGIIPMIQADPEKLKVAFTNFIDNAVKYTPQGGITVSLNTYDSKIQVLIKDTGVGILKDKLDTLFDTLFQRGENAQKSFAGGRGIGMYISNQIVKAHNGSVKVESEGEGKGTTFRIEFPVEKTNQ